MKGPVPRGRAMGNAVRCAAFLLTFAVILSLLSAHFDWKTVSSYNDSQTTPLRGFYNEPQNTIDVAAVGNSDMVDAFVPMELWHAYGVASYNCGISGQFLFNTYTTLTKVFSRQRPKAVLLDADCVFPQKGHTDTFYEFVNSTLERYFPLLEYHNRWNVRPKVLPYCDPSAINPEKGYVPYTGVKPASATAKPEDAPASSRLDAVTRLQLDQIGKLCSARHADLILVYIPTRFSWNPAKHRALAQYAAEHRIPFLDMNDPVRGVSLDWATDSRDGGIHLNERGAQKVTARIGTYLHGRLSLPDHRAQPSYRYWNDEYRSLYRRTRVRPKSNRNAKA